MAEVKKEDPKATVAPTHPTPQPSPQPGQTVRKGGVDVEAAVTRVGGTPGRDAILSALQDLEQRTADRLGDDHKKGSKAEFEAFRNHVRSIVGEEE